MSSSYSTYGTGSLGLVDGDLSANEDAAAGQLEQITQCVAAGAARSLLDTAEDTHSGLSVNTDQWPSAQQEGWETSAIAEQDLPVFLQMCRDFVQANVSGVLTLAARIAWGPRWDFGARTFHGDEGMAIYRIGMLLGDGMQGVGAGFEDYFQPRLIDGRMSEYTKDPVVEQLNAWVAAHALNKYPQTWVDSAEEPFLLHLSASGQPAPL